MASVVRTFPENIFDVAQVDGASAQSNGAFAESKKAHPAFQSLDDLCNAAAPLASISVLPRSEHMNRVFLRRRIATAVVAIVVVLLSIVGVRAVFAQPSASPMQLVSATSSAAVATAEHPYVVQPGDTLWSIAVAARPHQDPREVIAKARSAGLRGQLNVGDKIVLP